MTLDVQPLHPSFGAQVGGVTVNGNLDAARYEELKALWHRYKLLLFRDQNASEQDLVDFSRGFGDLEIHVRSEYLSSENPELLYVSNIKQDGRSIGILADGEVGWHYDQIYLPKPAIGSMLCAVEIPPAGQANTLFADLIAAFNALPESTRQRIAGSTAVQSYEAFNNMYSVPTSEEQKKKTPDREHPLVRTHPFTGEQALYLCPGMTTRIVGLDDGASAELLQELFDWSVRDEFVYQHKWQVGDCLMWDNACTMHRRESFDPQRRRLMKRTTILAPDEHAVPYYLA